MILNEGKPDPREPYFFQIVDAGLKTLKQDRGINLNDIEDCHDFLKEINYYQNHSIFYNLPFSKEVVVKYLLAALERNGVKITDNYGYYSSPSDSLNDHTWLSMARALVSYPINFVQPALEKHKQIENALNQDNPGIPTEF